MVWLPFPVVQWTSIIEHQRTPHPSPYFQILQQWDKYTCGKVFKNGPSKICGRQPLKNLKEYGLPRAGHTPSNYSKAVFHKVYLVHSWIVCVTYAKESNYKLPGPLSWKVFMPPVSPSQNYKSNKSQEAIVKNERLKRQEIFTYTRKIDLFIVHVDIHKGQNSLLPLSQKNSRNYPQNLSKFCKSPSPYSLCRHQKWMTPRVNARHTSDYPCQSCED